MDTQTGLLLFNAMATAGKNLYEIAQGVSKLETKQQLMDVYDTLMNLKRQAADLEDENRNLREQLRFTSDEFEFKLPFWYEKSHPERALCPKCFAKKIVAPVGQPYDGGTNTYRKCLHCDTPIEEHSRNAPDQERSRNGHDPYSFLGGNGNENG